MYGLHPLMPIVYIVQVVVVGHQSDSTSMRVLTSRILKLEKLRKVRMQIVKTNGIQ